MVASVGCRGGRSRRGCRARTSPSLPTRSWIPARIRVAHGSTPGSLVRLHLHSPQSLTRLRARHSDALGGQPFWAKSCPQETVKAPEKIVTRVWQGAC